MAVVVDGNTVADVVDAAAIPAGAEIINLDGNYLVPAFIDLQIYGGNGKLFSQELNFAAIDATDEYCAGGGCTGFLITMATNSIEKLLKGCEVVAAYQKENKSGLMGLHLEGPYMNPFKRGAHIEQYIQQPSAGEIQLLIDKSDGWLKMMTLAPECCSDEVLQLLHDNHVIVSAGHSNASYEQATAAFNKGISTATHLFNAMSPLQSPEPGMVGAVYDHAAVKSSIVCDGVHTSFAAVSISKKIMKERLFLITDAVTESAGEYTHVFKGNRYILPDGTLSGSALSMIKAVNNCIDEAGIAFEEALRMASLYPAEILKTDNQFGKIEKGYAADFAVLSSARTVLQVIRNGRPLQQLSFFN
jgi:N-acetylglucosamine-6-phosphate deacetylase